MPKNKYTEPKINQFLIYTALVLMYVLYRSVYKT